MEKINVAELLRDCPKGMEMDCTAFNNVKFQCADNDGIWIEYIDSDNHNRVIYLTCEGGIKIKNIETKCIIFPKGKTTWEGFVPPYFKDGDIIYNQGIKATAIFNKQTDDNTVSHCFLNILRELKICHYHSKYLSDWRLATEEEKEKLFQAIKDNGYKWNPNNKTLEKLIDPKFKIGNWYQCTKDFFGKGVTFDKNTAYYCAQEGCLQDEYGCHIAIIKDLYDNFKLWTIQDAKEGDVLANDHHILILKELVYDWSSNGTPYSVKAYCGIKPNGNFEIGKDNQCFCGTLHIHPATEEEKAKLFDTIKANGYRWNPKTKTLEELPRFNVGDKIRHKNDKTVITITGIKDDYYYIRFYNVDKCDYQNEKVSFKDQDKYELVPEFKNGDVIVCENHWGPFISIFKENVTERNGFIGHCVLDVDDNEFKVKDSASYFNEVRFATKSEKELLFRAIKNNGYKWNPNNKTLEKSTPDPDKFDITSLKTFDQVLVRDFDNTPWEIEFFSRLLDEKHFKCSGLSYVQCIPYKGNEHLNGKKDDCDEYFKTWE